MPEVKRIELANRATVRQQLHLAAMDTLPEELAGDRYVHWITQFDGLTKDVGDTRAREDDSPISDLTELFLKEKVSFYFASIFHIGRMLHVSSMVLQNIHTTREDDNFHESAVSLSAVLEGPDKGRRAEATLRAVLAASEKHHTDQFERGHSWWALWRKEVGRLHDMLQLPGHRNAHRDRNQARVRIAMAASAPSSLKRQMLVEGVQFKTEFQSYGELSSESLNSSLIPLLLICLTELDETRGESLHEARHMFYEWGHEQRARRAEPAAKIALEQLQKKYGDKNPFDEFRPAGRPASPRLRTLLRENKLPGDMESPWRLSWERTLEGMPRGDLQAPAMVDPKATITVQQADSAIKRGIGSDIRTGENWSIFLQRLFENEWVRFVGVRAGSANKSAVNSNVWSVEQFSDFVLSVVSSLNAMGYALCCPPDERLATLLGKASRGESVYSDKDW